MAWRKREGEAPRPLRHLHPQPSPLQDDGAASSSWPGTQSQGKQAHASTMPGPAASPSTPAPLRILPESKSWASLGRAATHLGWSCNPPGGDR